MIKHRTLFFGLKLILNYLNNVLNSCHNVTNLITVHTKEFF